MADRLEAYRAKRDFSRTSEPQGGKSTRKKPIFLIQKHDATRLHFDFRLEIGGVLASWAVTKGPSFDPADKRLAVRTEDHPLDYANFEGTIPKGEYGGGTVMLWDRGTFQCEGDAEDGLREGKLKLELEGERLKGGFALVRMRGKASEKRENWLLIKEKDRHAKNSPAIDKWTRSVTSEKTMGEIAQGASSKTNAGSKSPGKKAGPATNAPLPRFRNPQLATLADTLPAGNWVFETKFDGYRMLAAVAGENVRCYTRNGKDWTARFRPLADALGGLGLETSLLDGEVVVAGEGGRSDFSALQAALKDARSNELRYFIFDALHLNGEDLRDLPLAERRRKLERALPRLKAPLHLSEQMEGDAERVREHACERKLEGIIAKRVDAPYRSRRTTDWLKLKCANGEEFVIGGWCPSSKGRPFSSILLGVRDGKTLRYRGRVGTGFDEKSLIDLYTKFKPLARKTSPFEHVPPSLARRAKWIAPQLVAQIRYAELTASGHIRHGSFQGLRQDKPADDVTGEKPLSPQYASGEKTHDVATVVEGVRLTHPGKFLFPSMGLTKKALAEYYVAIEDKILPYLTGRPLSILRCPEGAGEECFFQKHAGSAIPDAIERVAIAEKDGGKKEYLAVRDVSGLVATAQVGALELHGWQCRTDKIESPDRMIFDLDPAEDVPFKAVRDAARDLSDVLREAGLKGFPMVTGGKGIHLVLPLDRRHDWPEMGDFAKAFADKMTELDPGRFIANMSKAKRKGLIFIDYLRNRRGATAIMPYSPRAREGAPIAYPLSWKVLMQTDAANAFTLKDARGRKDAPWADYFETRQSLTKTARSSLGMA